ncbi:MAG TPA: ATP-binding protein [Polyangiaceae bacterium]|nr:ATP-binding protein [Polyangiaceae bacterium]
MVTQRSIAQVFLALQAALTAFLAVFLLVEKNPHAAAAGAGALVYVACWVAFRKGWEPARQTAVITLTLILVIGLREPYLTQRPITAIMVPPIVALILTSSRWIVGSAALALLGLSIRSHFKTPLLEPLELSVFIMLVSGLVLARRSVDAAIARLAAQAESAERAREQAEAAAREAIAQRDRATKLEAALLHMQRLESIGRLAGGVAHDFNNLLTVIGASASMAERAIASGSSANTDLQEVHLAVGRASELTRQLLTFARRQVLVKRGVELNELVSNVERMLARVLGENAVLSATLCAEPLRVMADAGQLEQVLVNLVINARDAIGEGRGSIELVTRRAPALALDEQEIEGLTGGDYACIEVRDSGAGMTDEVQQRLFEPFFTTKAPGRGTGLGLATSFGIVRQHDGSIRVESEPGKGTLMRVLLPLATGAELPATSGVVRVARERHRVLVVEDEPQVRAIAVRALSSAGFEVLQAANGAAGLSLVKSERLPFDVIVTDVVMPELSGPELARAVRQLEPTMGLVFMSGLPEAMHSAHAGEFAGAAFLNKPFSPQVLIEAVRERIALRGELRELG